MNSSSAFLLGVLVAGGVVALAGGIAVVQQVQEIRVENLRQPTLDELVEFLASDHTELMKVSINSAGWGCVDFAITLRSNAMLAGYDFDVVLLNFEEGIGHALNGVRLASGQYVWVEPQTDEIVKPVGVGETYALFGENYTVSYVGVVD